MSDEPYRSSPAQYPPEAAATATQPPAAGQPTAAQTAPTPFNIAEEFGTARKNLPPVKIVLIAVAAIAVIGGIVSLVQRPHSSTTGSIDNVVVVPVPNQNQVMVAVGLSIHNQSQRPYTIHTIKAELEANGSQFNDEPASAVDFDRYFQAFPALQ